MTRFSNNTGQRKKMWRAERKGGFKKDTGLTGQGQPSVPMPTEQ